jgi:hypothetical protein
VTKHPPWESIIDFATSDSFCGKTLYPRQQTLLRLLYLETEHMTAYDIDVIDEWCRGFVRYRDVYGVQPDIWERVEYLKRRGYRRFPHFQAVLGRRASKNFLGGLTAAEQIAYLIAQDNPQHVYGIDEGKDCFLNVGATSQTQAQRHQFADIRTTVEDCTWLHPYIAETKDHQLRFRTPADLRRIASLRVQDVQVDHLIASLWVVALSASSVAGRGATSYANYFDEFAHQVQGSGSVKSGEEIYEDWQPSLGQFKKEAFTYVPSSPFTKTGHFFEIYQHGSVLMRSYNDTTGLSEQAQMAHSNLRARADLDEIELSAEPGMLIFQGPSWCLYEDWERGPELVQVLFEGACEDDLSSEEQLRRKLRNPEKFKVEREGQFAEVLGQYLDADKVDAIFKPVPWRDPSVLEPTPFGRFDITYRIHVDPSKTGANFALAIAHVETGPCDRCGQMPKNGFHRCEADGTCWPHVIIDRLKVWKTTDSPVNPETGKHEIDYTIVEQELDNILYTFPSTSKFSSDQWNSIGFLQRLKKKYAPTIRVYEETATEKSNYVRAEKFKSLVNLGWLHSFLDTLYDGGNTTGIAGSLLAQECKFLSEKNGKIYKQEFGPVQTKDLFDAVSVIATDLLHEALERWDGGHLTARAYGSSNSGAMRATEDYGGEIGELVGNMYRRGHHGRGEAWDKLEAQLGSRGQSRSQGARGYQPDRSRSISSRETGKPTWGRYR